MNTKIDELFSMKESFLSSYLIRTTENLNKNLWEKKFKFKVEATCLEGVDFDINKPLTELKNPQLVFSLMVHCLGRSLLCSETVHNKFKNILKTNLKTSCDKVIPNDSEYSKKIQR